MSTTTTALILLLAVEVVVVVEAHAERGCARGSRSCRRHGACGRKMYDIRPSDKPVERRVLFAREQQVEVT